MRPAFFATILVSLTLVQTPSVRAQGVAFPDVPASHAYDIAINSLAKDKIIQGRPDGKFDPDGKVNRAELLSMAYKAADKDADLARPKIRCFVDVLPSAWFAPYVCAAKQASIVSGRPDKRFHGEDAVTLSEAAKIISLVNGLQAMSPISSGEWYAPYLQALTDQKYLPTGIAWVGEPLTRAEVAEILWRVRWKHHDQPAAMLADLGRNPSCQASLDLSDKRIDMARVREAWFSWINEARSKASLPAYVHDRQLDRTANDWARTMRDTGSTTHKRNPGDPYYDYWKINQWFVDRGVEVKNVNRVTHTENIGGGYMSCNETDCTDELIDAIRPTFDYYMGEVTKTPGTMARAHYESVMNKTFKRIGFGIALSGNKVYSATHYVTEIISDPVPVCAVS